MGRRCPVDPQPTTGAGGAYASEVQGKVRPKTGFGAFGA